MCIYQLSVGLDVCVLSVWRLTWMFSLPLCGPRPVLCWDEAWIWLSSTLRDSRPRGGQSVSKTTSCEDTNIMSSNADPEQRQSETAVTEGLKVDFLVSRRMLSDDGWRKRKSERLCEILLIMQSQFSGTVEALNSSKDWIGMEEGADKTKSQRVWM